MARFDVVEAFGFFKRHKGAALAIALLNFVGIAYGFVYYMPQFAITPALLWAFVPDSPLAVLWGQLALLAYWGTRARVDERTAPRWVDALDALAWVGNAQVGLWTVYVLLAYADEFGTYTLNINTVLFAGHAAMVALGAIFLAGLRARVRADPSRRWLPLAVAGLYYGVNDALDYFGPDYEGLGCGLRPITVPCDTSMEGLLAGVTIALTLLALASLAFILRPLPQGSGQAPGKAVQDDAGAGGEGPS